MIWRIFKFIQHQFYLRYRRGHGIHSPYLFEFVHEVLFNSRGTMPPAEIVKLHRELLWDRTLIHGTTPGTTSSFNPDDPHTVSSFVRTSSVSRRYGALLFRITQWFKPGVILELGTGLGVSTLYLASGYPEAPLHTLEGNGARATFAADLFYRCSLEQVSIHRVEMGKGPEYLLPEFKGYPGFKGRFVAFLDANHHYEPTLKYVRSLLENAGEEAVIIMDDIYWSRGMYRAWLEIISWPGVRMSVDLFHMGVLLLRKDLQKTDLKINL